MTALIKLFFCILYSHFIQNRTCKNGGKYQLSHRYMTSTDFDLRVGCWSANRSYESSRMTNGAGLPKYWPIYAEKKNTRPWLLTPWQHYTCIPSVTTQAHWGLWYFSSSHRELLCTWNPLTYLLPAKCSITHKLNDGIAEQPWVLWHYRVWLTHVRACKY